MTYTRPNDQAHPISSAIHVMILALSALFAWGCCSLPPGATSTTVEAAQAAQATNAIGGGSVPQPIEVIPAPEPSSDEERYPQWAQLIRQVKQYQCEDFNLVSNKVTYHYTPGVGKDYGDEIRFMISTSVTGSLHMFQVDQKRDSTLLFPNQYMVKHHISAGDVFDFPTAKMRKRNFSFRALHPQSQNIIVAVWNKDQSRNLYKSRSAKLKKKAQVMVKASPELLFDQPASPTSSKRERDDTLNKLTNGQFDAAVKSSSQATKGGVSAKGLTGDQLDEVEELDAPVTSKGAGETCAAYVIINVVP